MHSGREPGGHIIPLQLLRRPVHPQVQAAVPAKGMSYSH